VAATHSFKLSKKIMNNIIFVERFSYSSTLSNMSRECKERLELNGTNRNKLFTSLFQIISHTTSLSIVPEFLITKYVRMSSAVRNHNVRVGKDSFENL
jgi:hypothetical protein